MILTRWLENFRAGLTMLLVWSLALLLWPLQLALTLEQERRIAVFRDHINWVEKLVAGN